MRKIFLFPVKLLILPVLLLLFLLSLLGKLATNLSAYLVGLLLLVLASIGVYCLWAHRWVDAAIVAAVIAGCLLLQFGAMFLAQIAGEWAGSLLAFLRS